MVKSDVATGGGTNRRHRNNQKKYIKSHTSKRNIHRKNNYKKGREYDFKCGERWTPEDEKLVTTFEGTDRELAKKIFRSVVAIQVKRGILKKKEK